MKLKPKEKPLDRLRSLASLISMIDSYRAMVLVAPEKLEYRAIESGIPGIRKEIREIMHDVDRIVKAIRRERRLYRMIRLSLLLKIAAALPLAALLIILLVGWQGGQTYLLQIFTMFPLMVLFIVVLPNAFLIFDYFVRMKIAAFKEKKVRGLHRSIERMKEVAQKLIFKLNLLAERWNVEAEKLTIRLYHSDYDGVIIKKKPSFVFPYYVAVPVLSGGSEKIEEEK